MVHSRQVDKIERLVEVRRTENQSSVRVITVCEGERGERERERGEGEIPSLRCMQAEQVRTADLTRHQVQRIEG